MAPSPLGQVACLSPARPLPSITIQVAKHSRYKATQHKTRQDKNLWLYPFGFDICQNSYKDIENENVKILPEAQDGR